MDSFILCWTNKIQCQTGYMHQRTALKVKWTTAPPGRKKMFQKEQPAIGKKPSLSIHIELYNIHISFPNQQILKKFF